MTEMDELLAQLESRSSADGTVTDEEWAESIRLENDWIAQDERPVIRRGPARSAATLDALEADLATRGLSLPADYRIFLERHGGLALDACAEGETPGPAVELCSGLLSLPQVAEYPDGAPSRLVFFDNGELGYFAFEFGNGVRLVDQSGDWAGRSPEESCTAMPHQSFTAWLATHLEWGLMTFSYTMVDD